MLSPDEYELISEICINIEKRPSDWFINDKGLLSNFHHEISIQPTINGRQEYYVRYFGMIATIENSNTLYHPRLKRAFDYWLSNRAKTALAHFKAINSEFKN